MEPARTEGAAKQSSVLGEPQTADKQELAKTGGNSTTRSRGAAEPKADRVYLRVPITEVIIKTSFLPEKSRSRSTKQEDGHGSGGSTVQLLT